MSTLRFGEIVERSQLETAKANYALKQSEHLRGMPEAGASGRHRQFTPWQAFKLVVFCMLSDYGFQPSWAGPACEHVVKATQSMLSDLKKRQGQFSVQNATLRLDILNRTLLQVRLRDADDGSSLDGEWVEVVAGAIKPARGHAIVHGRSFMSISLSYMLYDVALMP